MAAMKLFRLCTDQIALGQPLPWSVHNEPGQLLLSKGYVLQDSKQLEALIARGVYVDQEEFEAHEKTQAFNVARPDAVKLWSDLNDRVAHLLSNALNNPRLQHDVQDASVQIQRAILSTPQESVFEMLYSDPLSHAVSHSVNTAFVAALTATRLGWRDSEQATLTNAALTMNIAALTLHNTLATQRTAVTPEQREALAQHPHRSRAMLEASGVTDGDWLRTVEHHHVTPDGKGLPQERGHLTEQACLIHYADVYMAKLSARAYRNAMPAHQAARDLFVNGGGAQNPYVATLIKEIGIYPPGSFVQLANGDTAVVVKRGEAAHAPEVHTLMNSHGQPYRELVPRDTSKTPYKVVTGLPRGQIKTQLDRKRIFGYAAA